MCPKIKGQIRIQAQPADFAIALGQITKPKLLPNYRYTKVNTNKKPLKYKTFLKT